MKFSTFGKIATGIVVASAVAAPLLAFAQPPLTEYGSDYGAITKITDNIGSWMLGILIAVAVIFVIYAAFLYLTSGGDEGKVTTAKNYIIYAIIAVIVGILAKTIISFAQSIIKVT